MFASRPSRPLLLLLLLVLCAVPLASLWLFPVAQPEIESRPLAVPRPGSGPRFRQIASLESGLRFQNSLRPENCFTYLTNGAGMAVADFDRDGLPDLYLVSQDGPNRLFRQSSPLRFEDVTARAGGVDGGEAWGTGATFADVDGDGWLDLYVCNMEAKNLLYRNRGDGTFEECAARFGLDVAAASTMAAFCDFDQDGDLDVYVATNRALHAGWSLVPEVLQGIAPPKSTRRRPDEMVPALRATADPQFQRLQRGETAIDLKMPESLREHFFAFHGRVYMAGQPDRLLRNDGGRFVDATAAAGMADHGMGLSATWCDYDRDGRPDLYVANDLESPDILWHNEGNGGFRDVTRELLPHTAYYGMGTDSGDVDGDLRPDFFVADMSATTHRMAKILMGDMNAQRDFLIHGEPQQYMRNALLLNTGTKRFQEAAFLAGVASTDWTWSTLFGDLDNDGRLDLFCTNGIARFDMDPDLELQKQALWQAGKQREALDLIRSVQGVAEKNLALRNAGDLKFERTGAAWGLDVASVSHGAVLCDLDRDGDLDVVTNDFNQEAGLYENTTTDGNAIAFVLVGGEANTQGIGARIDIVTEGGAQMRENWLARGYLSGQEARVCFGVGSALRIRQAIVRWPSGSVQVFADLATGHEYTIREPRLSAAATIAIDTAPEPMFEERSDGPQRRHQERPFDDFEAQFLLPQQLSKLGPGLAFGDADGDGDDDLFVGGAAGQAGAMLRNDAGHFVEVAGPWRQDAECEDLGILWLDYDADGDQDLLVCSGGVEAPAGSPWLRDRLYRNDGAFTFVRDESALPDVRDSSSSACAADVDGDGDLDLVVGGRLVPGAFPDAPSSRFYRNDGGRFVDATADFAPALQTAGMVTSVALAPMDGDRWPDLLIAAQWQPLRLLRNRDGKGFEDATEAALLSASAGQWNSLQVLDADGDLDLDVVAGNLGHNTKYKASVDRPLGLVWSDFDDNGTRDVVETKYEGDRLLPVRGRSCSSQAMPFVAQKFPTYAQFAGSVLGDIYPQGKLANAGRLSCMQLDSSWLQNDGDGRLVLLPLPHRAQIAPLFGSVAGDFDGDARTDVLFATNSFSPEPETGHFDGGTGLQLAGDPAGFRVVAPSASGFVAAGDQKGLALSDLDGDGRPEAVLATNNGPLRTFGLRGNDSWLSVQLHGGKGNPTGVGARVTVHRANGTRELRVILAGSGYLSQSSAQIGFSRRRSAIVAVVVTWPDDTESRVESGLDQSRVSIAKPH